MASPSISSPPIPPSVETLWVSTHPFLKELDRPLLAQLSRDRPSETGSLRSLGPGTLGRWDYFQELDEPCQIETALILLHDALKSRSQPLHLIGHGTGGALALLYTRKYPHRVRSLTLLGIGAQPALNWHALYYIIRQQQTCSSQRILAGLMLQLFDMQTPCTPQFLVTLLQQDLQRSNLLHSLAGLERLPEGGVEVPLLILGSDTDPVAAPESLAGWRSHLKPTDHLWQIGRGGHFFHTLHSEAVAHAILAFWQHQPLPSPAATPVLSLPLWHPLHRVFRRSSGSSDSSDSDRHFKLT